MWGTGFVNWPDIPWRRSVVQMVLDCEDVARVISEDIMTAVNLQVEGLPGAACWKNERSLMTRSLPR